MIKTVRLAGYELRRFKGPLPIIGLLFLLLLPTIIGATYLWSNWDPYGRLDQVPVAVVNLDQPVQVEAETIDAGDRLVTEMKADPVFDWHFVSEEEADQGLADGDYYMIVTIPADFSANLISGEGTDPTRAVVDIRLNDANGYLADLLALSAQSRLEAAIDRAAVGAYFDSVFANLDTVKVEVTDSASSAAQLAVSATAATTQANDQSTGITTAKDSSSLILSGLADAKILSTQLVTSSSDAKAGSASLLTALTGVENNSSNLASAADDVASTSQSLASSINPANSSVNAAVQPLGQASSDLPVISSNLQTISSNLTSLAQELALTPGIDQSLVTEVIQNGADVAAAAGQTNSAANSVSGGYDSVQSASSDLSGASSDLTSLTASSAVVASEASAVSNGVSSASSAASTVDSSIANLSTDATSLDASIGNLQLSAQQLDDGLGVLVTGSTALAENVSGIDTGLNLLSGQLTTTAESIPTISSQQVQDSEQVLSSPADVNVTVDNPATFYGRGLAPLLFAVAIWIFGLAVFLVLRPIAARALAGRASTARITMAAWLPIFGIATAGFGPAVAGHLVDAGSGPGQHRRRLRRRHPRRGVLHRDRASAADLAGGGRFGDHAGAADDSADQLWWSVSAGDGARAVPGDQSVHADDLPGRRPADHLHRRPDEPALDRRRRARRIHHRADTAHHAARAQPAPVHAEGPAPRPRLSTGTHGTND